MKGIALYIGIALMQLHKGAFVVKLYAAFKIAMPLSVFAWMAERFTTWGIANQDYIGGVLGCIAVDHLIGSIYHLRQRDFTLKKNALGLVTKLALCVAAALLFEILQHAMKDAPFIYEYLKIITRLVVLLYPAGSAFMNMSALTDGVFPPIGWIKKIKAFNENLDIEKFKGKHDETD